MAYARLKRCIRVRGMSNDRFGSKAPIRASSSLTTASGQIAELNQGQNQSAPMAASGQERKSGRFRGKVSSRPIRTFLITYLLDYAHVIPG
jgi:hypothetical protein